MGIAIENTIAGVIDQRNGDDTPPNPSRRGELGRAKPQIDFIS